MQLSTTRTSAKEKVVHTPTPRTLNWPAATLSPVRLFAWE